VIGSQQPLLAVAPQQELPPAFTRSAALPYFSLDYFLDVWRAHELSLFADANNLFELDGLISSTALRVQELKKFLKCVRVGGVSEECALTLHTHEILAFEFLKVVRQSGIGNVEFDLDLSDDQAVRVR
jgi:hypothetical protein